jgi:DNA (cytosine-5)-methyltransferase 1
LGSLFDGIGGWLDAGIRAGIKPIWASEIEPFPCAVTAHHYPDVKQVGDITKIDVDKLEPVDIICAGSPCQDLSIAGKREGLAGERSGLFRKAVDIVHALRNRTGKPKLFIWENVCGAFSSNGGSDFRAVLEEIGQTKIPMPENGKWASAGLVELPGCQIAWRVLDSQFFGVPQRRKRIFLIASFGKRCAGEILFIEPSLPRDSEKGRETRERTTASSKRSIGEASGNKQIVYPFDSLSSNSMKSSNPHSGCHETQIAKTLDTTIPTPEKNQGGVAILKMRSGCEGGGKGALISEEKSLTLSTKNDQVLFEKKSVGCDIYNGGGNVPMIQEIQGVGVKDNIAGTLDSNYYKGQGVRGGVERTAVCDTYQKTVGSLCGHDDRGFNGQDVAQDKLISVKKTVRRLTPIECERLQGWEDNYTNVPLNGKPASDSARYKALGNGMAQPCARWLMQRVVDVLGQE